MEHNLETIKNKLALLARYSFFTANRLSDLQEEIEAFERELIDIYTGDRSLDGHILIQYILKKGGKDIIESAKK